MQFARFFVIGAALAPALALADEPVIVTPQPQPQPPVVVVNPTPAEPPRPTIVTTNPERVEVYDAWNAPLFATGALTFLGSYGAAVIVAGTSDHVGADRLYVPVAGPWLALNDWGNCPITEPRCDKNTTDKVLLVADGLLQAGGVITMVTGLLRPSHHTVYTRTRTAKKDINITPTHNGVTVFGRF